MILLDTHVWIWFHTEPARLRKETLAKIEDPNVEVAISSISAWEVAMLWEKGRIGSLSGATAEMKIREWLFNRHTEVVNPDIDIFCLMRSLPFEHRDPADHVIAATAFKLQVPLITSDVKLLSLPWLQTIQA